MDVRQAYRILDVEPGSDPKNVQKAYRRQALKSHPDRARSEDEKDYYTKRFIEVRDAYEFLRKKGFPNVYTGAGRMPTAGDILEEEGIPDVTAGLTPAGRSFAPKGRRPEDDMGFAEKMGWRLPINLEGIALWAVILPGSAVFVALFIRWLMRTLSGGDVAP